MNSAIMSYIILSTLTLSFWYDNFEINESKIYKFNLSLSHFFFRSDYCIQVVSVYPLILFWYWMLFCPFLFWAILWTVNVLHFSNNYWHIIFRTFCCSNRWFTLDVYDTDEMHVGHLERPTGCVSCFCGCCSQSLKVNFPPKKFIGEVNQKWSFFGSPKYQ